MVKIVLKNRKFFDCIIQVKENKNKLHNIFEKRIDFILVYDYDGLDMPQGTYNWTFILMFGGDKSNQSKWLNEVPKKYEKQRHINYLIV